MSDLKAKAGDLTPRLSHGLEIEIDEVERDAMRSRWHSISISVFSMCCAMIGAGVVGLPHAVANCGWWGIAVVIFGAFATGYTGVTLGELGENRNGLNPRYDESSSKVVSSRYLNSYPAIGRALYGPGVEKFVLFVQWLNVYSVAMLYIILAAGNMNSLVSSVEEKYWILAVCGVLIPFSWIKTFRELLSITIFGFLASLMVIAVVIIEDAVNAKEAAIPVQHEYGDVTFKSFFQGYGTIVFAYGGHCLFLRIIEAMPNKSAFRSSVVIGYVITCALYVFISAMTYAIYGKQLQNYDNILDVLPDSWPSKLATAGVTVHVMMATLIFLNPAFLFLEESVSRISERNGMSSFWSSRAFSILWRTLNIGFLAFCAEAIPNFGDIQSLIGGTAVTMLCFIFPAWFYLKMYWSELSFTIKAVNAFILIIGAISGAFATYFAVVGLIDNLDKYGTYL